MPVLTRPAMLVSEIHFEVSRATLDLAAIAARRYYSKRRPQV
jgi:hypothetical protein